MNPKVSVLMGIYNCADFFSEAVESIINQTYKNWELIMCDDGSTDDTYAIAQSFALKHSNIMVVQNEKNMRLAYSLNHCLQYATGVYIARMDADDASMPDRLSKQVSFLQEHPEYEVVGCALQIRQKNTILYIRTYPESPMQQEVWSTVPFAHPTILMRKEILDKLGGYRVAPETMRAEDLDLWFRFKMAGYNGYNLQYPLYIYEESLDDYKKRSIKAAFRTSKVLHHYYKLLDLDYKYWYLIVKPIVAALTPACIMVRYHKNNTRIK